MARSPAFRRRTRSPQRPESFGDISRDATETALVVQPYSQTFGLAQIFENLAEIAQRLQRVADVEANIHGLFQLIAILGKIFQYMRRLLEEEDCFSIGAAFHRLSSRLA